MKLAQEPPWGLHRDARGLHSFAKYDDGLVGVLVTEEQVGATGKPALRDLSELLIKVHGSDFGVHDPALITRFTDAARQAAAYRAGRVLLAGDAAHVHYPAGGQGLNIGVQDAVNLGWKLAQVVKGISPASLLDTYQAERHPIAVSIRFGRTLGLGDGLPIAFRFGVPGGAHAEPEHKPDVFREPAGPAAAMIQQEPAE